MRPAQRQPRQWPRPKLTIKEILAWADAHHAHHGKWPTHLSGPVQGVKGETWGAIHSALSHSARGMPGGTTLAKLLSKHRGLPYDIRFVRGRKLTIRQVRSWAQAYFQRTGLWPSVTSGPVERGSRETWTGVNLALCYGYRGLPGGSSLAKVLGKKAGTPRNLHRPRITIRQILSWADAFHQRTGCWPKPTSGPIPEAPGETWYAVDAAVKHGIRGLPGGGTMGKLLARYRGLRYGLFNRSPLTVEQILSWADAYHRRNGRWPQRSSGRVREAPGETWIGLNSALISGSRALPRGSTLADLLARHRGVRNIRRVPKLTESQVLQWAKAYHLRTGDWPISNSGPIPEAPGETWSTVACAMHEGNRGMSGRISLTGLLVKHFDLRRIGYMPPLTLKQILEWAVAYYQQTGRWPNARSGAIKEAPDETWAGVNHSLYRGHRGLPGGHTLARLCQGLRTKPEGKRLAHPLTTGEIISWAKSYCRRMGQWPDQYCGKIADAPGEIWLLVDEALREGTRGLPGGSSLKALLVGRRKPKPIVTPRTTRRVWSR